MKSSSQSSQLPLTGVKVVEFEGIGPGPLAGFHLVQLGASVTLVARPGRGGLPAEMTPPTDSLINRGKHRVTLNLKTPRDKAAAIDLIAQSDALIEGNRPGVMERLGLGPQDCAKMNPRIVYGRMTGWGQDGPLANAAGHDMNYVALTGLMSLTETPGHPPILPPTVLGDAAGALGLTMGIVAGLLAARSGEGKGCVVDGAIVDVLALLAPLVQLLRKSGALEGTAASVFHDSPFYDRYRCADGRYITVGAIEPQFYALLLEKMGLSDVDPSQQMNRASWPALKVRMTEAFASRSSRHWIRELEGSDACFAPVLTLEEAAKHPHNVSRGLYRLTDEGDIETARGLRFLPLVDQDHLKSPQ